MEPHADLTALDIPGRAAEIEYTPPAPTTWPATLTAVILHILAAVIGISLASLTWQIAGDLEKQLNIAQADYQAILATGWVIALTIAMILIAIGQILLLAIRTECNTRQQKELIFYWLRKTYPPKH